MALFDTVTVEVLSADFQTKQLGEGMLTYRLAEDGRLVEARQAGNTRMEHYPAGRAGGGKACYHAQLDVGAGQPQEGFAMLRNRLHPVIPGVPAMAPMARRSPLLRPLAALLPLAGLIALIDLLAVSATPAQAEVFHVKLRNGSTIDTLYQPQQAAWDPNVVILLSDAGNWIGIDQRTIESVESETQIRGFGIALNFNTIAIGWAPNDAIDPATLQANPQAATMQALQNMYQQQQEQARYTVPQFVSTEETAGIPARMVGGGVVPGLQAPLPQLPVPLPVPAAPAPPPAPMPGGGPNQ
jgi:hypothetical protein